MSKGGNSGGKRNGGKQRGRKRTGGNKDPYQSDLEAKKNMADWDKAVAQESTDLKIMLAGAVEIKDRTSPVSFENM